jgi:hypothetical protein
MTNSNGHAHHGHQYQEPGHDDRRARGSSIIDKTGLARNRFIYRDLPKIFLTAVDA